MAAAASLGIAESIESASRCGVDLGEAAGNEALWSLACYLSVRYILNRMVQYSKARLDASFAAFSDATRSPR